MATEITTATATRTLIAAGFSITNSHRQPTHIEVYCQRSDMFGVAVPYLIAICDGDEPPANDLRNIKREAEKSSRVLVLVAKKPGQGWSSWPEFLESLGGPVPSWRALSEQYEAMLLESSRNSVPTGLEGEAWQIFEDAIADGFEFLLGYRVNRLGGRKRGRRVSDIVAQTPSQEVLLLDAKASKNPFDATWPELRALVEYTKGQVQMQKGQSPVRGAILVANSFAQDEQVLARLAGDFIAEVGVPLSFLEAQDLARLIKTFAAEPSLRSSIAWSKIFCRGGLLSAAQINADIQSAREGRYPRGEPLGHR